jgi:hypothetical protein
VVLYTEAALSPHFEEYREGGARLLSFEKQYTPLHALLLLLCFGDKKNSLSST